MTIYTYKSIELHKSIMGRESINFYIFTLQCAISEMEGRKDGRRMVSGPSAAGGARWFGCGDEIGVFV